MTETPSFPLPETLSLPKTLWLIVNNASGSVTAASLTAIESALAEAGLRQGRTIHFPDESLPSPAELDGAGISLLAVFGGDGTINRVITDMAGWGGTVLTLPGGTMNLLPKRLHGTATAAQIIARIGNGDCHICRPGVVTTSYGVALAELMAGPGTSWAPVREAIRDADLGGMINSANQAMTETIDGPPLHLVEPQAGRTSGYPLIAIIPTTGGLRIVGYYAETFGEFIRQGAALVLHRFREGLHDNLGISDRVVVRKDGIAPVGLLLDGEQVKGAATESFELAPCPVDLLATAYVE